MLRYRATVNTTVGEGGGSFRGEARFQVADFRFRLQIFDTGGSNLKSAISDPFSGVS
jgi:hypothetical protein